VTTVPRTRAQLERAAADAEAWLDSLDPDVTPADHVDDLRNVTRAVETVAAAEADLAAAVDTARRHGRSWQMIGLALGVSTQAAQQRFGAKKPKRTAKKTRVKKAPAKRTAKRRVVAKQARKAEKV
jgi:hypothetical protein